MLFESRIFEQSDNLLNVVHERRIPVTRDLSRRALCPFKTVIGGLLRVYTHTG